MLVSFDNEYDPDQFTRAEIMKITSDSIPNPLLAPKQPISPTQNTAKDTDAGISGDTTAYSPSPELLRLLQQVRQQPDIRDDKVAAVMARLQQGFYATPGTNEKTAAAFMNSIDS